VALKFGFRFGVIRSIMRAAAFPSRKRAPGNQRSNGMKISKLKLFAGCPFGATQRDCFEFTNGFTKSFARPDHAAMLPRRIPYSRFRSCGVQHGFGSLTKPNSRPYPILHRNSRACAEHDTFQQRITRETIRAVHAGAGYFSGREQTIEVRYPVEIRVNAAHRIVRRGMNGRGSRRDVQPETHAGLIDAGKALPDESAVEMGQVEVNVRTRSIHFPDDRSGNDIARRKFAHFVVLRHESLSGRVTKIGAFAA
jgi:hypothetical protein